ncbi:MAG TPA: SIR2 family protein [Longimicrobium sp.]|nr:SIR2 family protein [Longimicrobium sp.]
MEFLEALPRLAAAHDQGVLVPFLGAGMSRPTCPDWAALITRLEEQAGVVEPGAPSGPADLVRRGNRAVRVLKRRAAHEFPAAMRTALYADGETVPPQTSALAAIWWPLVLTTNYDDLLVRAYRDAHEKERDALTVVGRSPDDCQRVLNALSFTSGSILWALQGYLGGRRTGGTPQLEAELVVGHEEYRRVTHTSQHFRRAFAEVFRRRSLLFLGSSLGDAYLLDLFGEILEFSGANPLPHYAMVRRGTADVRFLRSRFNVIALEYEDHARDLPDWLARLRGEIHGERVRPQRWTFGVGSRATEKEGVKEDLAIIRGPLPPPGPGECAAVSAGTGGDLIWLSVPMAEYVRGVWPAEANRQGRGFQVPHLSESYVRGFTREDGSIIPLVAVVARADDSDRRDLRIVSDAATELVEWAAGQGYGLLRMQLLASGKTRHFPSRFSLAETVRAFGRWRRGSGSAMRLAIHLVDPSALFEVATGRLDVVELLTCDDVRFWVEVVDGARVLERELVFAPVDKEVGEIGGDFELPADQWLFEVQPRPRPDSRPALLAKAGDQDLLAAGVISGATLRFLSVRSQRGE